MKNRFWMGVALSCALTTAFGQVEKVDTVMISKIKKEGLERSQVLAIAGQLTDMHGPRLTNSPNYVSAATYARNTLSSWGLKQVAFDTWDEEFGRGWSLKKFHLQSLGPIPFPVIAHPKAWTYGIAGTAQVEAVYFEVEKLADLDQYKGKLQGKIVLMGAPVTVKPGFKPDASRFSDSSLLIMANAALQNTPDRRPQGSAQAQQLTFAKWDFLMKEGVLAVLEPSPAARLEDGTVLVSSVTLPYAPSVPMDQRVRAASAQAPKSLPQVIVADEHYNRMVRQMKQGQSVKLELELETEFTAPGPGFNVIAEIEGTDLKDQVVMIGAHLDSWHAGTGATDNASGSAVMMEAMRIIQSLGVKPRRTIRIALWGGEEQGLLGSRNYVKRTFGQRLDRTAPYDSIRLKPAAEKFSVYFNMDNGTGKYRGVYLQGNEAVRPIFREWMKPFEKMGATTLTISNTGATDHVPFDAIGLPGFQFIQDPIEYSTRTHHTSMDVFDKLVEADLKHNAVMTAAFAWLAANRDQRLPRK